MLSQHTHSFQTGIQSLQETLSNPSKQRDPTELRQLRSTYFSRLPTKNLCARYRPLDPKTNEYSNEGIKETKSVDKRLTFAIAKVFGEIYDSGDLVRAKTLENLMKEAMGFVNESEEGVKETVLFLLLLADTTSIENEPFNLYVSSSRC